MAFWIVFGIIIGLIGILTLASKIKHSKQKINTNIQSTKSGINVYKSKSTKSNADLIKTSPIGDVHLINFRHVVGPKDRKKYMSNHKSQLRHVSIIHVDSKNNAKIADLMTIDLIKHKKLMEKGKLILLNDYSNQRGKLTGMSKKTRSIDLVTNNKFKINKPPLNNKKNKLTPNDLNDYFNK